MLGYTLSPQLIARIAELPNVVAIKNAIGNYHGGEEDNTHYLETVRLAGDKIVVSDPNEACFLENYIHNKQRALIAVPAPLLLQSRHWQPIQDYFELAKAGKYDEAAAVNQRLNAVRKLFWDLIVDLGPLKSRPVMKYWLELLGETGGSSVYPSIELSAEDKDRVRRCLDATGLNKPVNSVAGPKMGAA
jgi:4-hydroxy-tetrahydrodipicolinate synthase